MGILIRKFALVPLLLSIVALVVAPSAQAKVLFYPTPEKASFQVEIPDDWEVTPGDGEGDYVHVNSENGVYLAFRTLPASETAINDAIEDSVKYINENYQEVKIGEAVKAGQSGLSGFYLDGVGKDSEGTAVIFRMVWLSREGLVGEIWFAAPVADKPGIAAAAKALSSFRAP